MTAQLRLILFDVDGTLVDSQASILRAMCTAFAQFKLPEPQRGDVLSIVGLSLDHGIARLCPDLPRQAQSELVQAYKDAFNRQHDRASLSPLYPGARAMLDQLAARPDTVLGVATGKSLRGLKVLLADHGLEKMFVTLQVADHHPSKPHPSMIETAMAETGVEVGNTVMIGDTSFDMDMAQAAGVAGIGVSWGYHAVADLGSASCIINSFDELPQAINSIWTAQT